MASFCEECGTALSDLERFCTHCGTPIHKLQEQVCIGSDQNSPSSGTTNTSCPACKSPIPKGNEFCQACGKRAPQAPATKAGQERGTPSVSPQDKQPSIKGDTGKQIPPLQATSENLSAQKQDSASTDNIANRCPTCHHPTSLDDVFCNECGTRITPQATQDDTPKTRQETTAPSTLHPPKKWVAWGALGALILGAGYWGWHETHKPTAPAIIAAAQPKTSHSLPSAPIQNNQQALRTGNVPTNAVSPVDFLDTPYSKLAINQKDLDNLQHVRCDGMLLADYSIRKTVQERAEGFQFNNFHKKNTACHNGAYWGAIAYIQKQFNLNKQHSQEVFLDIWSKKIYRPTSAIDIDSAVKTLQNQCPDLLNVEKVHGVLFDENYLRSFMMFAYTEATPRIDQCGNQVADEGGRQVTQILGDKSKGRDHDRELYIKLADPKRIDTIMKNGGAKAYIERIKSTPSATIQ